MARRVDVVAHTHWDREWYRSFQSFRLRLVDLLDGLLDLLDQDPDYTQFLLDGQMAAVDDYLAVRPQEEERIRRLVGAGRLRVGPWYVLMDEFLVSGETLVRDLEMGLARAAQMGGAMPVGYLPDMFGHVAQMPQILAGFGLDRAVVWRGVPSAIDAPAFTWAAPDGSTVLAELLPGGYSNGADLPADARGLLDQIAAWAEAQGPRAGDPILWMNGTDHQAPDARLPRLVTEAAALRPEWDLRLTSLEEHLDDRLASVDVGTLPRWSGELRSSARTCLLRGVTSNRLDVRRRVAAAEIELERRAEPLWALFAPAEAWPQVLLDEAWGLVVRNAAHDSVCACSIDPVVDAVLGRYAEAIDIAEGLTSRALRHIGDQAGGEGIVVVNPSPRRRAGVIDVLHVGPEPPPGAQVLLPGESVRRILVRTEVDGLTWQRWRPGPLEVAPVTATETADGGALLANDRVEVVVDPRGGTWSIDGTAGLGRLVDGGDAGDTYTWCPPPAGDVLAEVPDRVRVTVTERGPVRGTVRIETDLTWPEALRDGARHGAVPTTVVTTLSLHAGEQLVRVETTVDNRSRDHRLRVHLPLPHPAAVSAAGCAFATVERGLHAESGPDEVGLPSHPARDHLSAGGLTVVLDRVAEYELVDLDDDGAGASTLAVTLLRSTGVLSQGPMATRPAPAGPTIATPGAQVQGVHTVRYGLAVDAPDPHRLVEDLRLPLLVANPRGPHRADRLTALVVEGAELSSARRHDGRLEVRIWNSRREPTTATLDRPARTVDLRGRPLGSVQEEVALRGAEVATLVIDED